MSVWYGCPNRVGSEKNFFLNFFLQKMEAIFCDPPHAPSGPPCPGGGSARARRRPPPGGPPKKGSPLPRGISRKKVQKRGQNRGKMGFLGPKMCQNVHILHIFDKKSKTSGELCRRKNAPQPPLSAVQKPANLYSTKCRFFGPPPPPGGYQWTRVHSRGGFRGPPRNPPAQAAPPRSHPVRLSRCGPCRWCFIIFCN